MGLGDAANDARVEVRDVQLAGGGLDDDGLALDGEAVGEVEGLAVLSPTPFGDEAAIDDLAGFEGGLDGGVGEELDVADFGTGTAVDGGPERLSVVEGWGCSGR